MKESERLKIKSSKNISQMQKAGREQRSTVDNVIIISLIIQKRKSERFNTYLFHADAVKCFGEL